MTGVQTCALPIYSYCLEARVEFGGELKVLTIDNEGNIEKFGIKNDVYNRGLKLPMSGAREKVEFNTANELINVDIVDQIERSRTSTGGVGNNNASRILSRRGSIIAEPRTNQIFVSDVSAHLAQVQELIAKLDVAVRQVLIEAQIGRAHV